jgi:hypothetical protein
MLRRALLLVLVSAAAACDARVTEGCLGGVCGSGGAGGHGGAAPVDAGPDAPPGCAPSPQAGDYPCDVFAVVHANCHPCHQDPPAGGAPFSLLRYADTQQVFQPGKLVFQQMRDQIQPGADPRMPFGGALTSGDQATLDAWLDACAPPVPAGTGCGCPGPGCD